MGWGEGMATWHLWVRSPLEQKNTKESLLLSSLAMDSPCYQNLEGAINDEVFCPVCPLLGGVLLWHIMGSWSCPLLCFCLSPCHFCSWLSHCVKAFLSWLILWVNQWWAISLSLGVLWYKHLFQYLNKMFGCIFLPTDFCWQHKNASNSGPVHSPFSRTAAINLEIVTLGKAWRKREAHPWVLGAVQVCTSALRGFHLLLQPAYPHVKYWTCSLAWAKVMPLDMRFPAWYQQVLLPLHCCFRVKNRGEEVLRVLSV